MARKSTLKVLTHFGTFTRTTARAYTHLVITTGESLDTQKARYFRDVETGRKYLAEYQSVIAAIKASGKPFALRHHGDSIYDRELLRSRGWEKGHLEFFDVKPEGVTGVWPLEQWQEFVEATEREIASYTVRWQAAKDRHQAITYYPNSWSSRLNLAQKYAARLVEYGYENVRIIEVASGEEVA